MYRFESGHRGRNRTTERKVTPITDIASTAYGRKGRCHTVELFGTDSLKGGAM
jgi:hypothetical protein